MKFGVSSYSFSQKINAGEMTQLDTVKVAKDMGFDCIEFIDLAPPEGVSQLEYAKQIREEAEKVGICINAYTILATFSVATEEALQTEIDRVKGHVDIAAELGVQVMRYDAMKNYDEFRSFEQALPTLVKGIRAVCDYAETKGIRTTVENHGRIGQDSDRVERLFNAVNHKNFGLLIDMGNFTGVGEDPVHAVSLLAPYAFHVHAKDFTYIPFAHTVPKMVAFNARTGNMRRGCAIGHGMVPVKQCMKILQLAGYEGDLSIEYEGKEDCIKGIAEGLETLKTYAKELNIQ